jgi:PAS domain S-box-containing protein
MIELASKNWRPASQTLYKLGKKADERRRRYQAFMSFADHNLPQPEIGPSCLRYEESSLNFLALARTNADVFWVLTPMGQMQEVTTDWQTFTGLCAKDSLEQGWLNAFHPAEQASFIETLHQALSSGLPGERRCRLRAADGYYRLVRLHCIPMRTQGGTTGQLVVSGREISEYNLAEYMNEAQVSLAVKAAGVGMWDWDLVKDQLIMTKQCKALLGLLPKAPVSYELFLSTLHPEDCARIDALVRYSIAEHVEYRAEYRVIWPDGSVHWIAGRGLVLCDIHNRPVHMMGALIEVTNLKRAEESACAANQRVVAILESITDGFAHIDANWRYTYVNQHVEEFAGKRREELLGRSIWEASEVFAPLEPVLRQALATQQVMQMELFVVRTQRWIEMHIYPARDGLSLYGHDITERKLLQERLQESELRLRRLVDANVIGMTIDKLDDGTIIEANDAFLSIVGYTREDLAAGRVNWAAMMPSEYWSARQSKFEEVLTTGKFTPFEGEYITKTGQRVPVLVGGTLFRQEGSTRWMICFIVDLSAQKALEQQKEFFLSMTSHELKTPLAALKGTLQLAQRRVKRATAASAQELPEWSTFIVSLSRQLATAVHQIDRQNRLINDLLDVSRIATNTLEFVPHLCDLVALVRETVEDLRMIAPERELLLALPVHTRAPVMVDTERISQVLTNYVTNALRYAPPEQPIEIGLALQEKSARVWVRDYGPGLSAEAQRDIRQRFYQAKGIHAQSGSGKGLGLGLYICQMLIIQHQGTVGVESIPGEGSTFWFILPLSI